MNRGGQRGLWAAAGVMLAAGAACAQGVPAPALVQVNVDAAGQPIANENANEPIMAIDPTAPSRVFVAWNNFIRRNGQWGYFELAYSVSLDGGRTWAPRARVEPGVRRANPHLALRADGSMVFGSAIVNDFGYYFPTIWVAARPGAPLTNRRALTTVGGDKPWLWFDTHPESPARGTLYASWNSVVNNFTPGIFSRSLDGGQAWIAPVAMAASPSLGSIATAPDGTVYLSGIVQLEPSNLFMLARSDNARDPLVTTPTFSVVRVPLSNAVFPVAQTPNPAGPMQQIQTIVDPSGPRKGMVYYLTAADPTGSDPCNIYFTRSADRGATWSAPLKVNTDRDAPNSWQWLAAMGLAPNGRLDVVWLDSRGTFDNYTHRLYYRSSSDGGATWGTEQVLSPPFNVSTGWGYQAKIGDYITILSDNLGASVAWTSTLRGPQDIRFTRIGPEDCNRNGIDDAAEIAAGTAKDCNGNGVPDSCDIASGLETDLNGNGIPDSCEGLLCRGLDYNRDGRVDGDDLADFVRDFYTWPPVPGGIQPDAPTYAGLPVGWPRPCPLAGDAAWPYAPEAYRVAGYRVGFALEGGLACPFDPAQPFPSLDNLADYVTAYYSPELVCPLP